MADTDSKRKADVPLPAGPTKRVDLLGSKVVTIIAKPSGKEFYLHSALLSSVSAYFKCILEGTWTESIANQIELEETGVKIMERFQLWLYSGLILDEGEDVKYRSYRPRAEQYALLYRLYLFADIRDIPKLQNSVVNILVVMLGHNIWGSISDEFQYAYDNLPPGSRLVRLILDAFIHGGGGPKEFAVRFEEYKCKKWMSKELVCDLSASLLRAEWDHKKPRLADNRCEYHTHADGEPKCTGLNLVSYGAWKDHFTVYT